MALVKMFVWTPSTNELKEFSEKENAKANVFAYGQGRELGSAYRISILTHISPTYQFYSYVGPSKLITIDEIPKELKTILMLLKD